VTGPRHGPTGGRRVTGDDGSATVLVLALVLVLATLTGLLLSLGAVAVARHRAASVADLAALAAAERALAGTTVACAVARRTAAAAGGWLTRCDVTGEVAEVVAAVRPAGRLAGLGPATARARAGPSLVPP
jgi:secretion/DNA translocation related TadE-like protein